MKESINPRELELEPPNSGISSLIEDAARRIGLAVAVEKILFILAATVFLNQWQIAFDRPT